MFRQFLRLSPAVYRNTGLTTVRRLASSISNPHRLADVNKQKRGGQRSNDLWKSLGEFNENEEQPFETAISAQLSEELPSRSTRSIKPNYSLTIRPSKEGHHPQSSRPTDQELVDHLNSVLRNLRGKTDVHQLLDSIQPVLPQLDGHQIAIVYRALIEQDRILRGKSADPKRMHEVLRESFGFAALLSETNRKIGEIDPKGLTIVFKCMRRVKQNPESEIIMNVTKQIIKRLDEFSLELVSETLFAASLYLHDSDDFLGSMQLLRFRASLLENSRKRVLNNELKPNNFEQLSRLFQNFLMNCQNEHAIDMLDRLTRTLLADFKLDFSRSVQLLGRITSFLCREIKGNEGVQFPAALAELIEKCNSAIYDTLSADPEATNNHYAYLNEVHYHRSRLYGVFSNFFDPRLLDLLGPLLAKEEASRKGKRKKLVLNLFCNFANVKTFNEELVELTCQMISNGLIDQLSVTEYLMLSKHRFPSVNHQQLLNAFKSSSKFLRSLKDRHRCQTLLYELILAEVNDPDMLGYLIQNTRPDQLIRESRKSQLENYDRTALARSVLSMYGQPNDKVLKMRLNRKLDERFRQLSFDRPPVSWKYNKIDNRLQGNCCFLSNGVTIQAFGIYDRTIGDLISLKKFRSKFERIDSIPLTASQEL